MGAFDDTICQLRDLGMGKVANIIRDLERDNITLAGNNFKLREELTTLRQKIAEAVPVAWLCQHDETGRTVIIDQWQKDNGWEELNPRYSIIRPLFDHPAPAVPEEK